VACGSLVVIDSHRLSLVRGESLAVCRKCNICMLRMPMYTCVSYVMCANACDVCDVCDVCNEYHV